MIQDDHSPAAQTQRAKGVPQPTSSQEQPAVSLRELSLYFLKLGAVGFGGPIALAGYMQRDLQEERHWISHEEFQDGLAIAQTMPGPLAAQLAMWIGFIRHGMIGATLVGVLFVLPPFLLVVAIAVAYVAFAGLPQIQALFYGIGPAAIAIIVLAAWKLAKSTDGKDPKLWSLSAVLMLITVVTQSELAWLFIVAGMLGILIYASPWKHWGKSPPGTPHTGLLAWPLVSGAGFPDPTGGIGLLLVLTLFFVKAAAFTFGSGLAIVPFLHQGVVLDHRWLTERQFLDAVAIGIITPGPVVIMATFVGYLAAGLLGASLAAFGVFAPVWVFNVVIGRLFLRYRHHAEVRGFVKGATAAAVGAIAGAAVILGHGAIIDVVTVGIFLSALLVLYFKILKEPYVIGLAGVVGLILFQG